MGASLGHAKLAGVIAGSCAAATLALGEETLIICLVTAEIVISSHRSSTQQTAKDSETDEVMQHSHDNAGGASAGVTLLVLRWARSLRQTGADLGSSQHLPSLSKVQPDEATSTGGQHSVEKHALCLNVMFAQSTACGQTDEYMVPILPIHAALAGCPGSSNGERMALEEQHAPCMAGASSGIWPQEGEAGACAPLQGRTEHHSHRLTPTSHAGADGLPALDFRHCNQTSDSTPNSLQRNSHFQVERAIPSSREVHGHDSHVCCQHESHQPDACCEHGMRSASAAAFRGHSSEEQRPYCSYKATMGGAAPTPSSSSSSLGTGIMAAKRGASNRARSRSSMVFEVA